jgi:sigma-B regulation protein RsbU (phosphoserine phosphatase)
MAMTPTAAISQATAPPVNVEAFLMEVADLVNTTLDLPTLLQGTADLIRKVIAYDIFAILLVNEKMQELRMRFQVGHAPEIAEHLRIKLGEGVTGRAAKTGEAVLVSDVRQDRDYIQAQPGVRSELAVPLIVKNRVIGVIDIEARRSGFFTEEHVRLLKLVASRIGSGIENARLYARISKQAQTLTVLNEISRELTSILNLDELFKRVGELLTRLIDYQMFSILLLDATRSKLEHRFSLRFNKNVHVKNIIPLGQGLVGYAALHKTSVVVPDVKKDPRYILLNPETRSELCVPLIYKDTVLGVLDLEHTRRGYFTEDHRSALTTLAAQVAIAIENASLYERIAREEERLERDLAMARELQYRLLPPCCPPLNGAELAAKYLPARAIGGDFYDFISYSGGETALAVGDVSGKGSPAALYAALVGGILRSSAASEPGAAEMLALLNTSLIERPIDAQFVSMIYSVWDDDAATLRIANSGLPRPIYCHQGKIQIVESTGLPLGMFEDAQYDEISLALGPGEVCVFFSDGISDARDPHGHGFGRARVEEIVAKNHHASAQEIVDMIFKAVCDFESGTQTFDDQTVLVVKVKDKNNAGSGGAGGARTRKSLSSSSSAKS